MSIQSNLFDSNNYYNNANSEIREKIDKLSTLIRQYDNAYYIDAEPLVSDREYDAIFRELQDLEKQYPEFAKADSPTKRVGGNPLKEFNQIKHEKSMLSLANTYSIEEIEDFDRKIRQELDTAEYQYVAELKYDGVAISLRYEDCELKYAVTRGDGIYGDDITLNIKTIRSLPLKIDPIKMNDKEIRNFEIRGEIYMNIADFDQINQEREAEGEKTYANPRNLTAGTLKSLDSKQVAKRKLQIVCYYLDTEDAVLSSHFENIQLLKKAGFPTGENTVLCKNLDDIKEFLNEWDQKKNDLPFQIDGAVLKLDSLKQQDIMGFIARSPKWAVAYKYEAESAETLLKDITLQVGRTGAITPVAELEPVFLSGSTISRASLHNADYISDRDIRIGDTVIIQKGGEVIPKVVGVNLAKRQIDSKVYIFPELCPCELKSDLTRPEGEANHYCNHPECPWQIKRRIEYFASRTAMNIDGLGEKAVDQFVTAGLLKNIADIYDLPTKREEIMLLDRWGEKSIDSLFAGIEASKKQSFDKVLFAIGIRFVGEGAAKILANNFNHIDKLALADKEQLTALREIGARIAESVLDFFKDEKEMEIIARLRKSGLQFEKEIDESINDKRFEGMTFVLTGELETMTRTQAKETIEKYGGRASSSVSKKTSYLVAGANAGSKYENAVKLGVKILSETEFSELIK
jgi:DNA ligase (NAD+)